MANDDFRSPVLVPTPTLAGHPATKGYVDTAVAGATGTSTLRGATDYDNAVAPSDGQVIGWSSGKYRPTTITPAAIGAASTSDLATKANDSAVVHNTGNESIGGQKTIPSGASNQWIFNIAPQIAVGTLANQPVRRDDARMTDTRAWTLYTPGAEANGKVPTWNGTAYVATTPVSGGLANLTTFGIYSVKSYGATGDGTTDDTAAIQAALNATPAGGICWLPPGVYRTSSALVVPPQVTLEGTHAPSLTYGTSPANPCVIRPLAAGAWTGTAAVVRMLNKTTGSYANDSVGHRLRWLAIDGSGNATAGMVGVQIYGFVREVVCEHVTVRNVTGDAFATVSFTPFTGDAAAPQSCNFLDCYADNCGGAGFVVSGPDCLLIGCNAQGCGYVGYLVQFAPNTQLIGCRAEWAGNHNFYITGSYGTGQGSGSVLLSGCSSDRANYNGILIDSTGSAAHNIIGFSSRRDGRNGGTGAGNYAGIQINAATNPVAVDGLTVYPGVNDDGAGTNSPQHGIRVSGSTHVSVDSGYIHAATTAVSDGGGNTHFAVASTVGRATGTTAAPVRVVPTAVVLVTDSRLTDARTPTAHAHAPGDVNLATSALGSFANGSTCTVTPNRSSVYRGTITGAAVTLAMSGTTDMEIVNVEMLATAATTLTFGGSIIETAGIPTSVAIPINKRWFGALRYITGVGWFLLASSVQN